MTTAPHTPPSRDPYSHVDREGNPKRTYETEHAATVAVSGLEANHPEARFDWYICSQGPQHWHVTRVRVTR